MNYRPLRRHPPKFMSKSLISASLVLIEALSLKDIMPEVSSICPQSSSKETMQVTLKLIFGP